MLVLKEETVAIASDADVVLVRQLVRRHALELRFSLVDQTKLVTAASELARNAFEHGRGGEVLLQVLQEPPRSGLRLVFSDRGPGIANVELAMKDGYTTGGGLGLGLGGAKRLVNEFAIESTPGSGTRITVTKWR
jgi:serine/threonine-protein kinase RsbT